jgi:hypothetical protein
MQITISPNKKEKKHLGKGFLSIRQGKKPFLLKLLQNLKVLSKNIKSK